MPFESSVTAWVLLWVAALSSLATFALSLRRERETRRKARAEEERAWSLHWADYLDDPPFRCLRLRLHDLDTHKCRLKSVTVAKPGGARISPQLFVDRSPEEPWHKRATADRTRIVRRLALAKDLDGTSSRIPGQQHDDAYFYVLMPKRPAFAFGAQTHLRVVCRVSEISRRARSRKITLISPAVDWAPADAPKAEDLRIKA